MKNSIFAGLLFLGVTTFALPSPSIEERTVEKTTADIDSVLGPMTYIGPITPGGNNHNITGTAEMSNQFQFNPDTTDKI